MSQLVLISSSLFFFGLNLAINKNQVKNDQKNNKHNIKKLILHDVVHD